MAILTMMMIVKLTLSEEIRERLPLLCDVQAVSYLHFTINALAGLFCIFISLHIYARTSPQPPAPDRVGLTANKAKFQRRPWFSLSFCLSKWLYNEMSIMFKLTFVVTAFFGENFNTFDKSACLKDFASIMDLKCHLGFGVLKSCLISCCMFIRKFKWERISPFLNRLECSGDILRILILSEDRDCF